MLQISTGKFFVTDQLHRMMQRGVIFTNYDALGTVAATTVAGTLTPTTTRGDIYSFVYEVEEKLEAISPSGEREILVGTAAEHYVEDFAAITSFVWNATLTPDVELAQRLIFFKHPSLGVTNAPRRYVARVFDERVGPTAGDGEKLERFVAEMMGLERATYQAALRAIRRYVNGLHRIADDLDLAYALLVASIESLAQDFDGFTPEWENYPQNKRQEIDKVLGAIPEDTAGNVRQVLLRHEHLALSRRYREFALQHIQPAFFREEAQNQSRPVRRSELGIALDSAYVFRSKYVHTLRELPRQISAIPSHDDTVMVNGQPVLTLHGLARIARHVIGTFIERAPKVEREEFDYRLDLPNVVTIQLAEEYWIHFAPNYNQQSAPRYLSGFLAQLEGWWTRAGEGITDLTSVLEKIESLLGGLAKSGQRRPLITLYLLYHQMVSQCHRPGWEQIWEKWKHDLDAPSIESLIAHIVCRQLPPWSLDEWEKVRDEYYRKRFKSNGILAGACLETAMTLALAEAQRNTGDEKRAKELISQAVDDWPGEKRCLQIEQKMLKQRVGRPLFRINWEQFLTRVSKPRKPRGQKIQFQPTASEANSSSSENGQAEGN